ncbi:MAG: hypothetical protein CVV23_08390 [Ignavibacteriae bacterium HGW-Ignavibacteriae-2]|jgi:hypothetical protein|nr:MAG: hypothetical protein CVV23_08390 [Ignavibacteriae bacterium HGW-Ignavibacteriae-2]
MMGNLSKLLALALVVSLLLINTSFGGGKNVLDNSIKYAQIEENLLAGLNSDNFGLSISSAYMLGEIQSKKAVNPLTSILRNSQDDRIRLVAALSLLKIDTERSIYVIQDGVRFNDSEKVRNLCERFYNAYLVSNFGGETPDKQMLFSHMFSDQK